MQDSSVEGSVTKTTLFIPPPPDHQKAPVPQELSTPVPEASVLTDADRDPEFFSIDLPSGFIPYSFKKMSVKQVKGKQQAKFIRAAREANIRYTVEAVTSLLGDGLNARDLTTNDFYFLLYWLRQASYPKRQFTITSMCTDPKHRARVASGEADPASLKSVHILNSTQLEQTDLALPEGETLDALNQQLAVYGLRNGFPLVWDLIETQEHILEVLGQMKTTAQALDSLEAFDEDEQDYQYLSDVAACLWRLDGTRVSVAERIKVVETMPADLILDCQEYMSSTLYGVRESAVVRCKECGAEHRVNFSISASDFS